MQIEYLRDLGMNVTAISGAGNELEKLKTGAGLQHRVIEFGRRLDPWGDLLTLWRLWRLFRKEKFTIVHSTTPKAGLITAVAAFLARVPIRLHTFTGQPWVNLRGPIRWLARFSDRIIGILNTRCYADSPSQRDFLVSEGLIRPGNIGLISAGSLAGVDLKRFDPAIWSTAERHALRAGLDIPQTSRVLIFIGRIARDKGIVELLEAFDRLIAEGHDTDLILAGPMDDECGGTAFLSIEALRGHKRVHYLGYTNSPERYLAISDLLCLPSYREGFGTVVIEAAAMGVATIGTEINGLSDAVVNNKTGVLVPVRDAAALHAALAQALTHPDRITAMGKAARERCIREYDANVICARLADEYSRLLETDDVR